MSNPFDDLAKDLTNPTVLKALEQKLDLPTLDKGNATNDHVAETSTNTENQELANKTASEIKPVATAFGKTRGRPRKTEGAVVEGNQSDADSKSINLPLALNHRQKLDKIRAFVVNKKSKFFTRQDVLRALTELLDDEEVLKKLMKHLEV